ncbi:MAG: zinc ABC transporter substrate-binding protein [Clostridia bacterium]|nr:zinc ABC transporter substrate-binding protein [Clostridia bacterium]
MRKTAALIFCVVLIFTMTACGANSTENEAKIKVVTTIFPVYDWIRNIAAGVDEVETVMLIDSGVDLHSFQPTAKDILEITSSDMFVFVGGESDEWVESALTEGTNKDLIAINLLDKLGDNRYEEELKEGMHGEEEEEEETEEAEYDEHIWLSLKNAKILCEAICEGLSKADESNENAYKANLEVYLGKLDALDKEYADAVAAGSKKTLLFGDRFPFRYLTEDYGLDYFAAFIGCSAESEASFKTIKFLADKTDELGLDAIIKIDGSDGKLADTIKQNTKDKNAKILTLNSMQSITANEVNEGTTYLKIFEDNLEVLKEAIK